MVKAVTQSESALQKMPGVNAYSWEAFTGSDTGAPVQQSAKKGVFCLQGTFGAAVTLEGSFDDVTYTTLKDVNGNAMSYTAAVIVETQVLPPYVRPNAAGVSNVVASLLTQKSA